MPLSFRARLRVSLSVANWRTALRSGRASSASLPIVLQQCENMLSIDQAQLDLAAGPRGILDSTTLRKVVRAIGFVIKSNCEPL
jgi:hypothetical protein